MSAGEERYEEAWTAEEVAAIEGALKMGSDSHEVALAIDRMFFFHDEADVVPHLRSAGAALTKAKDGLRAELSEELHRKWTAALNKQLRASVTKAKENAQKG